MMMKKSRGETGGMQVHQSCHDCGSDLSDLAEGLRCPSCSSERRDVTVYPPSIHAEARVFPPSITGGEMRIQIGQAVETDTAMPLSPVHGARQPLLEVLRQYESATEDELTEAIAGLLTPGVTVKLLQSTNEPGYTIFVWSQTTGMLVGTANHRSALGAIWALREIILGHTGT